MALLQLLGAGAHAAAPAPAPALLQPGTADHLLFDEHWTASSTGLTQTVHPPTKAGVVIKPEHPWEPVIFAYNSLVKVNDTDYRIYYDAIGCVDATCGKGNGHRVVCVALSDDGLTGWTKPDLGLHEFNGSKHNNARAPSRPRAAPATAPPPPPPPPHPRPHCMPHRGD